MEQSDDSIESFLTWAAQIGISDSFDSSISHTCLHHSLTISQFPLAGGRGLGASRYLRKGELILKVPKSALITRQTLLNNDQKLSFAIGKYPSLSSTQILAACLLNEMSKGESSPLHIYLMQLPHSYDVLATFGEFEKQALQVDDAIWTTEKAVLKAESEWKEARKPLNELRVKPKFLTFRAWLWACATISSRTMHIPWDDAGCLCPVGDLFNYEAPGAAESNEPESSESWNDSVDADALESSFERLTDGGFEEGIGAYCFNARRDYKKGEQVLLSYGTYTNLELLEHYGFLLEENPNDKVFIPLEPGMYTLTSWPKESMYLHQDGKPSFALLSALRLWATPAKQRKSVGHLVYSGSQISVHNEVSVMKWILNSCEIILKNLPTSSEEDRLILSKVDKIEEVDDPTEQEKTMYLLLEAMKDGKSDSKLALSLKTKLSTCKWRLAVQWRLGYKKILTDCISFCVRTMNSLTTQAI